MHISSRPRIVAALAAAAIAVGLSACTDSASEDGAPTPAATVEASPTIVPSVTEPGEPSDEPQQTTDEAEQTTVDVTAFEFGYTLSQEEIPAGEVTFDMTNTGGMDHDLVIEGVDGGATEIIGPTESASLTVTLEPGTYTLYCSVSNHRELGMEVEITVT